MGYKGQINNIRVQRRRERFVKIMRPRVRQLFYTFIKLRLFERKTKDWSTLNPRWGIQYIAPPDPTRFVVDHAEKNIPKQGWYLE